MPQVAITLAEGRTPEQIRALLHAVHTAVQRTTDARPDHIRVVVHQVPRSHWSTGDVTLTEADAAGTGPAGPAIDAHHGRDTSRRPADAQQEEQS
ncbi:tautomerase family protein [Streptomyces sp. NPDC096080]|uniref:tautomerase family protein n=1 Tax=Streptomyces sp. NPDC096080 TaxID=3156693 RepID=UPI003323B24A